MVLEAPPFRVVSNSLQSDISNYYPYFDRWLLSTFKEGMTVGERFIIVVRDESKISGLSLLKSTGIENKICIFYIAPSYRGFGLGQMLMDKSLSYFKDKRISISVANEVNAHIHPFLSKNQFTIEKRINGCYRDDIDEYFYSLSVASALNKT